MKLATSRSVDSQCSASAKGMRERSSGDVHRWVDMINAELQAEEVCSDTQDSVEVTVEFGRAAIDLATRPLNAGDSLQLDQLADEPLEIVVSGRTIARGELVAVDGQLGVRIVELLLLVIACLTSPATRTLADDGPRSQNSSKLFSDESSEVFETPFGSVRGVKSNSADDSWQDALRTNDRSANVAAKSSSDRARQTVSDSSEAITTPLSPRSKIGTGDSDNSKSRASAGWSATIWPLLLIVGLIAIGARWLRSRSPAAAGSLPDDVFELLGRKPIDQRTSVVLARCGSRLLLLNLSPQGLRTLAEIGDPVEADCLAGLCRATPRDQTLVETFRTMLRKSPVSKPAPSTNVDPRRSSFLDERFTSRLVLGQSSSSPASPEARS